MLAAQGLAVNNHMALTIKGPEFRTHDFAFNFFQKTNRSNTIQKIHKDLKME